MSFACPQFIININPALCAAVDIYCERTSAAPDAELTNAFTNVAFAFAAGLAWALWQRNRNSENAILVPLLILLTLIIGIGSFVFHTAANIWTQWADVVPILAFIILYLWLILTRFFDWSGGVTFLALGFFLALTLYLESAVPVQVLWGGAMYLPTLAAIMGLGAAMLGRWPLAGRKLIVAACVFVIAFSLRTLDQHLCQAFPIGTHFLWHLLNALLLYLLLRLVILHAPRSVLADM